MKHISEGFINQRSIILPPKIVNYILQNEITKMLYVTDIGYYPHAAGHYICRDQGSPQNILLYCVDGEGYCSLNGVKEKISKEQFFVIKADTPHLYWASEENPWTIYWMHFTGEKSYLFDPMFNHVNTIDQSADARIEDRIILFEEIFKNLEMGYSKENLEYSTLCLWHFLGSFRFITQYRAIKKVNHTDVIQQAITYMKNNIYKTLTLNDIASHVHYSPSHFGQLFLKKTGNSPLNYFMQLKIQTSCRYLDYSDLKIKEIAFKFSFFDQYHYTKVFTKIMGESPTKYKQRAKG